VPYLRCFNAGAADGNPSLPACLPACSARRREAGVQQLGLCSVRSINQSTSTKKGREGRKAASEVGWGKRKKGKGGRAGVRAAVVVVESERRKPLFLFWNPGHQTHAHIGSGNI